MDDRCREILDHWRELTCQERRIARAVMLGFTNREVAVLLNISHTTAKTHLNSIYNKFQSRGRGKLMADLYRIGVNPDELEVGENEQ